jgi:hypothetical protein
MKPMTTAHTKYHESGLQILCFQTLTRTGFGRIGTAQPQHTYATAGHLRAAIRTRKGGRGDCVLARLSRQGARGCGCGYEALFRGRMDIFAQGEVLLAL